MLHFSKTLWDISIHILYNINIHIYIYSIHTHGCHISGEAPADYVLEDVAPGKSKTYIYSMPEDHAGGMHFYHPHHHGCAALQVGGGAYGAFIILMLICQN